MSPCFVHLCTTSARSESPESIPMFGRWLAGSLTDHPRLCSRLFLLALFFSPSTHLLAYHSSSPFLPCNPQLLHSPPRICTRQPASNSPHQRPNRPPSRSSGFVRLHVHTVSTNHISKPTLPLTHSSYKSKENNTCRKPFKPVVLLQHSAESSEL